jgi:FtsP/CotA-like multicopper oxidase with cupredoxin domain
MVAVSAAVLGVLIASVVAAQGERQVEPTVPETPGVATEFGELEGGVRTFEVTASEIEHRVANFPFETVRAWGYNGSTPGPTLVAYEGETVRVKLQNQLDEATTIHFHGMHMPNEDDGVAGVSQVEPVPPGESHLYEFEPGHVGTFAYHAHTNGAKQTLRGLEGIFVVLPETQPASEKVDRDFVFSLQQFAAHEEDQLVEPFPDGGHFGFHTMNGTTGEAPDEPLTISEGDRIRVRLYNASNQNHAMHLHGHDFEIVSRNGHPVPRSARNRQQTQDVAPGEFFEIEWTADEPGNWAFHCHVPHHTTNHGQSGWNGSPVGMTRIFHYEGYEDVRDEYFHYEGGDGGHGDGGHGDGGH